MACTTATCTVPVHLPSGDSDGGGGKGASLALLRINAARRSGAKHPILGGRQVRFPVGASGISAPEGSVNAAADCGCQGDDEGAACGAGGCGPSCDCAPCAARYGNARPVATPITAFAMGYPQGPEAMRAAQARGDAARASVDAAVSDALAPSAGPAWQASAMRQSGSYPSRTLALLGLAPGSRMYANGLTGPEVTTAPMLSGEAARWIDTTSPGEKAWAFGVPDGTSSVAVVAPDGAVRMIRLPTLNASLDARARTTLLNVRDHAPTVMSALRPSGAAAVPHGYTEGQWRAMSAQTREAARLMALARPAGAVSAPARPWAELTNAERVALMRDVNERMLARERAIAPSGDPTDVPIPEWARGRYSQTEWNALGAPGRAQAEEQWRAAQPGQGWAFAGGLIGSATSIVTNVLNGQLQQDLANIQAQSAQGVAAQQAAAAQFVATTNQRIAELQLAAAQANAAGAPAQAAQFQQAIATMQQAQAAAQSQNQQNMNALAAAMAQLAQGQQSGRDAGISPVVLGGGVLALGTVAFLALRKR